MRSECGCCDRCEHKDAHPMAVMRWPCHVCLACNKGHGDVALTKCIVHKFSILSQMCIVKLMYVLRNKQYHLSIKTHINHSHDQ